MSSLPYTLSAEDTALFQSLQASALLPTLARPGRGEMVELFKQRKREEHKKAVESYADLLEIELVKMLEERKASILQQLKDSKGSSFTAKLFSWKTVSYHESLTELQRRKSEMTADQMAQHPLLMRERRIEIMENQWESYFSVEATQGYYNPHGYVEEETYSTHYPMKVDRIFRHSDLAMRLSLKLGPNFYPFIKWDRVEGAGAEGDHGFSVFVKTLSVRYNPFGVNKEQMMKLLAVAKTEAQRAALGQKTGYTAGETPMGHKELNIVPPAPVPLLDEYADPAPRQWRCVCGCLEDDE
jgi:hypothetical protein